MRTKCIPFYRSDVRPEDYTGETRVNLGHLLESKVGSVGETLPCRATSFVFLGVYV